MHSTIPRSCIKKENMETVADGQASGIHDRQDCEIGAESSSPLEDYSDFEPNIVHETLPSLHEMREKAAVEGWSHVRLALLKTTVL